MKINILLLSFLLSFQVYAYCPSLSIVDVPSIVNLNNDLSPKETVRLYRGDSYSECDVYIGIDKGSSSTYNRKVNSGANSIPFSIATNNSMNRVWMDFRDASSSQNYFSHKFKAFRGSDYKKMNIYAELDLVGNEPPGVYSDSFFIKAYQRYGPWYLHSYSIPITYQYTIPSNVAISIVGSNQSFDPYDTSENLNFNTLIQGDAKNFDIVVQSNSGYILKAESQNNGKLKHTQVNSTISYVFKANGGAVNLTNSSSNPQTISSGVGAYPNDGFRVPIQIEIGSINNKIAGNYSDQITITVTTNL